jgi:hypothetical protein
MKFFSSKAFEHLLFELHGSVYASLERCFEEIEAQHPGGMAQLCHLYALNAHHPTTQGTVIPDEIAARGRPLFDVYIILHETQMHKVRKHRDVPVRLMPQVAEMGERRGHGNHLVVVLQGARQVQSFIVPLALVCRAYEEKVCRPGRYQVYEHALIREQGAVAGSMQAYLAGAGHYVGITRRTWQARAAEHVQAARRGSYLRFHRALREEFFAIHAHEHVVLRAGLTEAQAMHIEEVEVDQRTLHPLHPNGLNMIPGGEAGLRFLASMTKRPVKALDADATHVLLEQVIHQSLRQAKSLSRGASSNAKLAQLWQSDLQFRIKAITNSTQRLSYAQILHARIWHASGWSLEKITQQLQHIDTRRVTLPQLQRLLSGETYDSIPHVMVDMEANIDKHIFETNNTNSNTTKNAM